MGALTRANLPRPSLSALGGAWGFTRTDLSHIVCWAGIATSSTPRDLTAQHLRSLLFSRLLDSIKQKSPHSGTFFSASSWHQATLLPAPNALMCLRGTGEARNERVSFPSSEPPPCTCARTHIKGRNSLADSQRQGENGRQPPAAKGKNSRQPPSTVKTGQILLFHLMRRLRLPGNRYTMSRQKFATILLPSKIRSMKPEAFVSPLPSLPRLRNILNFEECVRFEDTISQTIGSIDGLPVDLRQLISLIRFTTSLDRNQFFSELVFWHRLFFSPPPTSEQIAFSLEEHIWKFLRFVDGLKFPAEAAAKLFLKSFRGFFGDMVKDEFLVGCAASPSSDDDSSSSSSEDEKPAPLASATSVPATSGSDPAGTSAGVAKTPAEQAAQELAALDQETELHRAVERVRDLAQRLDEAAALHLSRGVTTAPRPVFGHSFGHGHHRERAFAGRVPFQPPTPSPPATASVPPHPTSRGSVERSRLRDQGLCTWCHSPGHVISDCIILRTTGPRAPLGTSTTSAPTFGGGRYPRRSRNPAHLRLLQACPPPAGVPPTPVGPVTSVVPAGTPAPSASVVATTPCSGAATTAVTFPSFGKLDPQLTTTVVVNGVSAPALLDTGAMISVISPAFAHDLALPVVEDGPVRSVLLADGSRTSVQRFSPVTLRLSPECKPQQAVLYHLGRDPLILVGLSELRGHGLVLGDTPTITPLNIPVDDDDNDLGDDDYGGEAIVGRLVLAGPLGALDSDGQPDLAALALAAPRIATLATPPSGVSESPPVRIAPAPDQPYLGKAAPTLLVVRRDVLTEPEAQQVTDLLGEYAHLFGGLTSSPAVMEPFRVQLLPGASPSVALTRDGTQI
ncbi:hypothetical protein PAPYR_9669 [Paratrimastix pyriformis]|uniref:Peptidase A2 domain-containing protein n=1 Tax=Paratrimastix pyriformis TaxID=342808 RepID=A0ABQ8UBW9_9EUKA|nr:hypothetical protein PAPYR_9669 [Paratrimastix pyriformis]